MAKVSATVCNVERSRTSCQKVETEFMTPAATVLHKKSFLRAAATTYVYPGINCQSYMSRRRGDTVPHKRLISKLNSLNISKEVVNWIEAFISNRRQKVAVNGKESNWHDVTSGIPQGTVLGPLLFVLYINDLPDLTQSDTFLFADDIKIFRSIINTNDQDILQQDITTIEQWSHDWMLTLHPEKCTHMEIGKK